MSEVPRHFFEQSAVIPYRARGAGLEILLITSRKRKRWVIPKGVKEPELTPRESARREALEEAGIAGEISRDAIGSYTYHKWGGTCRVEVYAMRVREIRDAWPESHRGREWVAPAEAGRRVDEAGLRRLIEGLGAFVRKR